MGKICLSASTFLRKSFSNCWASRLALMMVSCASRRAVSKISAFFFTNSSFSAFACKNNSSARFLSSRAWLDANSILRRSATRSATVSSNRVSSLDRKSWLRWIISSGNPNRRAILKALLTPGMPTSN